MILRVISSRNLITQFAAGSDNSTGFVAGLPPAALAFPTNPNANEDNSLSGPQYKGKQEWRVPDIRGW